MIMEAYLNFYNKVVCVLKRYLKEVIYFNYPENYDIYCENNNEHICYCLENRIDKIFDYIFRDNWQVKIIISYFDEQDRLHINFDFEDRSIKCHCKKIYLSFKPSIIDVYKRALNSLYNVKLIQKYWKKNLHRLREKRWNAFVNFCVSLSNMKRLNNQ